MKTLLMTLLLGFAIQAQDQKPPEAKPPVADTVIVGEAGSVDDCAAKQNNPRDASTGLKGKKKDGAAVGQQE